MSADEIKLKEILAEELIGLPRRVDRVEDDVADLSSDVRGLRDEMSALRKEVQGLSTTLHEEGKANRELASSFSEQLLQLHTEGMEASRNERKHAQWAMLVLVTLVVVAALAMWGRGSRVQLSSEGVEIEAQTHALESL